MKRKLFALLLSLCMALTMMPSVAFAAGDTETLQRLTLCGGGYTAYPSSNEEQTVGNGIFTENMTVKYDGNTITDYTVSVENTNAGTVAKSGDGTFTYTPKSAGKWKITITYGGTGYSFYFDVEAGDLPKTTYNYGFSDNSTLLPNNMRTVNLKIKGTRDYGRNQDEKSFDVTSVVSDNNGVAAVTRTDHGYEITAKSAGTAEITVNHEGFDNSTITKKMTFSVVNSMWNVDCEAVGDCRYMLPGGSVTLKANVEFVKYVSDDEGGHIKSETKPYIAAWSLVNNGQTGITLQPATDGKSVVVKSDTNMPDGSVPVRLEIYKEDTSGEKGNPVGTAEVECCVSNEFYTLEADGFDATLGKGKSITITPKLYRHYMNEGEPSKSEVENEVTFKINKHENLEIKTTNEGKTFVITRPDAGNAGFGLRAEMDVTDGKVECDRWYEFNWIDDRQEEPEHSTLFLSAKEKGEDLSCDDKFINMSLSPSAEENCFYLAVPKDSKCDISAYNLINTEAKNSSYNGDTRDRNSRTLTCEGGDIFETYFNKVTAGAVTIDDKEYSLYKINLTKYIGHGDLRVVINEDNDNEADNWINLRFVLNVTVKGDAKGVKRLYNAADLQRNLFNFESEYPDVALEWEGDKRTGTYYNAMDVYYQGKERYKQGDYSEFALELEDGYVLNNISFLIDGKETPATFNVSREYDYAVYDEAGNMLRDENENFKNAGWEGSTGNYGGIVMSGPDKGENKVQGFVMTNQVVLGEDAGASNQHYVAEFLNKQPYNGTKYTLKYLGALTNHLVHYGDYYNNEGTVEIVFDVQKLPEASEIKTDDFDKKISVMTGDDGSNAKYDIEASVVENADLTGENGLNKKLEKEYHSGYSVEKVFEITATKDGKAVSNLEEYATITIPKSMFKGNPKYYRVMNVDDSGNMVEMETTYQEKGDYIVFKTGHLSKYAIVTNEDLSKGSSSSGGSSGGYIAPTTDTVTNKTEDKTANTTATTTATVKNTTTTAADGTKTVAATVDTTTANKIVEKVVENKSTEVVVNAATATAVTETAAGTKTEVTIPATTVSQVAEKTEAAVTIKSDAAEVTLDKKAVKAIAEAAGTTGEVKLEVATVAQDEGKVELDLKLVTSKGNVSDFKGGSVSVTIKLNAKLAAKKVKCVYIDDNRVYHKVNGQKNADGTYTFETGHFSTYAVMEAAEADKVIAEQEAEAVKLTKSLSLKARSAKTKAGNIKVTLTVDKDAIKAIEDLGYRVKYKFYRSTKKAKGYKAKAEGTSKNYTNTTGKKGTKYYYKARVMVYDADGKLVAKSALTQCKYASRTK